MSQSHNIFEGNNDELGGYELDEFKERYDQFIEHE
jgi:hypothetical protein